MARPRCYRRLVVNREAVDNFCICIRVSIRNTGQDEKETHPRPAFSLSKVFAW